MTSRIVTLSLLAAFAAGSPACAEPQVRGSQKAPSTAARPPAGTPAASQTPATTATPRSADPRTEALAAWMEGFFPWGQGDLTFEPISQVKLSGYHLYRFTKTYKADQRANDQAFVAVEEGTKAAIVGDVFVDDARVKAPAPIRGESDLDGLRQQLGRFFRGRFRLALDPSLDRKGWKGLKLSPDSGYGPYDMSAYVTASDGALLILGRVWDRSRPFAEQRKALMKLAGTPAMGPADATVTVVEYSDMQCPYCKKRAADWDVLVDKLAPVLKIRRYYKAFPLVNEHPWAFRAASAGRCFFEKDPMLYFRWKSNVFARQETLSVGEVDTFGMDFAVANDIPETAFAACYLNLKGESVTRILGDMTEGFAVRVRSTPTFFVDGQPISWFSDDVMEEYLRKTYLKGAGLPLPARAVDPKAAATKPPAR